MYLFVCFLSGVFGGGRWGMIAWSWGVNEEISGKDLGLWSAAEWVLRFYLHIIKLACGIHFLFLLFLFLPSCVVVFGGWGRIRDLGEGP